MMDRPSKYQNLPDVDFTAPDVFETPDPSTQPLEPISTADQTAQDSTEEDRDIIKQAVSMQSAVGKFRDALVETAGAGIHSCLSQIENAAHITCCLDYSDQLAARKKAMYRTFLRRTHPTDLPASADDTVEVLAGVSSTSGWQRTEPSLTETPVQKLRRLLYECSELEQELEQLKSTKSPDALQQTIVAPEDLLKHVNDLKDQLNFIEGENCDVLKGLDANGNVIAQNQPVDQLLQRLQSLRVDESTKDGVSVAPLSNDQTATSGIKYELICRGDDRKQLQAASLSELDKRLTQMETILGVDENEINAGTDILPTDLQQQVTALEQYLRVISDPNRMDQLLAKYRSFNSEIAQMKKDSGESKLEPELVNKKSEGLFEIADLLLDRLQSLKPLHLEAANFSQTLRMAVSEQSKIKETLQDNSEVLNQLETTVKSNHETSLKNLKVLGVKL